MLARRLRSPPIDRWRRRDVILTVAYGKICDYPTYRAFLNSYQTIRRPDLKLVAFGGNMSRSAR